jgi:hypothetical protein
LLILAGFHVIPRGICVDAGSVDRFFSEYFGLSLSLSLSSRPRTHLIRLPPRYMMRNRQIIYTYIYIYILGSFASMPLCIDEILCISIMTV